jgi:FtsP/CotA-like multicopper oxidase with cupredoxin domain
MDLMDFIVAREVREAPVALRPPAPMERLERSAAAHERRFQLRTQMMDHSINGIQYDMERADLTVRFGDTEIWTFENTGPFPHPVHMHGVHFQVLSRTGGRNRLMPWESGWKDTVLVLPEEQVEVIMRFDRHRGLFILHCHNLEHEDMGMMLNFLIE